MDTVQVQRNIKQKRPERLFLIVCVYFKLIKLVFLKQKQNRSGNYRKQQGNVNKTAVKINWDHKCLCYFFLTLLLWLFLFFTKLLIIYRFIHVVALHYRWYNIETLNHLMEVVKSSSHHNAAARCYWQYWDSKTYLDPIIKSVPGRRFESYYNIYAIYIFQNAHLLWLYCRRKLTNMVTSNAFNTLFSF